MKITYFDAPSVFNLDSKNSMALNNHPFHLVSSSPWPAIVSVALGWLALLSAAKFSIFLLSGGKMWSASMVLLVVIMTLWFRDITFEGSYLGDHSVEVVRGIVIGMALFIVTELLVFFAIFWSYFHSALSPTVELGSAWPPMAIDAIDAYALPFLNTALLLGSGATVTLAHHSLVAGLRPAFLLGMALTLLLSFIFTGVQSMEYYDANFSIVDSVYASTFYIATGTHGFHVIIGTLFLLVGAFRAWRYRLTTTHHNGLENSIVYWHMVDVVWLFLFGAVYWWSMV